jgi:hypothetical protein
VGVHDQLQIRAVGRVLGKSLERAEIQAESGELMGQTAYHPRQPRGPHGSEVAHGDPTGAPRAEVGDQGLGLAETSEDSVRRGSELPAGRGGTDPSTVLLEQHQPRLPLESGHVLTDGGRRVAEVLGRSLDATTGHDRAEHAKTVHIEHVPTVQLH